MKTITRRAFVGTAGAYAVLALAGRSASSPPILPQTKLPIDFLHPA